MEIIVVAAMLSLVVLLGIAVKLYDLKRKREEEAVAAQARVSDALLMDAALSGMPLTPTAHLPLWKGTPLVLEIDLPESDEGSQHQARANQQNHRQRDLGDDESCPRSPVSAGLAAPASVLEGWCQRDP